MSDVFISYSEKDVELAKWLYKSCENFNISAFLASISLHPGIKWKREILHNLKESKWFFFLATSNSIHSDAVKHEIGGALTLNKNIVPILYGIDFNELPEWIKEYQGIKVTNDNVSHISETLGKIAERLKEDKLKAGLLIGAFIGVLLLTST